MSFLAMLKFVPRWAYILLGVVAILVGLTHWHNGRVDAAVTANTTKLTDQFTAEKQKAIEVEAERGKAIVAQTMENYDAQINTIKNDAASMLANHRTGTVRLSVPASCPIVASNGSSTQSNTDGVATQSRAELSDDAVRFFVGQAERSDKQAVQLNSLIDIVEQLKTGAVQ